MAAEQIVYFQPVVTASSTRASKSAMTAILTMMMRVHPPAGFQFVGMVLYKLTQSNAMMAINPMKTGV